ncbi:MAG: hypothetical protein IID48_19810 [Proteobacteria bacterium]|nr:hypothetical protein [Pseudomonadota bacterium]
MAQHNAKKAVTGHGNKATTTSEQRSPKSPSPTSSTPLIGIVRLLARQAARDILESSTATDSETPMKTTAPPAMPATNTAS